MSRAWQEGNKAQSSKEGVVMKKCIVFTVGILVVFLMFAWVYGAEQIITGITKSFDAKTGRLVIQTETRGEATYSIPQTVKAYLKVKGRDTEVANAWQFLQDNLMKGTRVQILPTGGTVITIWILEVPR
jgi:hypothetical protein